jgi:hypothetical protein
MEGLRAGTHNDFRRLDFLAARLRASALLERVGLLSGQVVFVLGAVRSIKLSSLMLSQR